MCVYSFCQTIQHNLKKFYYNMFFNILALQYYKDLRLQEQSFMYIGTYYK